MSRFGVEVFQNEYLPSGGTEVHAVISVTSNGGDGATAPADVSTAAEVIVIDVSSSMGAGRKLEYARLGAAAAIRQIRDGVHFAVLAGSDRVAGGLPTLEPRSGIGGDEAASGARARRDAGKGRNRHRGLAVRHPGTARAWRLQSSPRDPAHRRAERVGAPGAASRSARCLRRRCSSAIAEVSGRTGRWQNCVRSHPHSSAPSTSFPSVGFDGGRVPFDDAGLDGAGKARPHRFECNSRTTAAIRFVRQVHPMVEDLTGRHGHR